MPEVYWISPGTTSPTPGRLGTMARPRGGDWLADEMAVLKQRGVDRLVSALTPQEVRALDLERQAQACMAVGLRLTSIPIPDREVPESALALLRELRPLTDALRAGETIVTHCRAGIGRSSLLAGAILCCCGWTSRQAWPAISAARGLRVPDTREQEDWLGAFADVARLFGGP